MGQVKLILREDIEKLGQAGDLVSVKPGFARNFLLPQGKATIATDARVNELEHHRRIIADEQAKALKDLQALKQKIESTSVEVTAQAGAEGKLFGSVTLQQVAAELKEKGLTLDRRKMNVAEPIKTVGEHIVEVRLHRELSATVKVVVSASAAVAPAAAEAGVEESLNVRMGEPEAEAPSASDDDDDDDDARFPDDDE